MRLGQVRVGNVVFAIGLSSLVLTAPGCDRAPRAEALPEWTPADHRSADDDKLALARQQANQGGAQAKPAPKGNGSRDISALVDLAWRQQCVNCHGAAGHGDGQMGAMLHATDLTDPDWQGRVSDAQMAASIKNGKNRMPRFDLPDAVIAGLVARIRALKGS